MSNDLVQFGLHKVSLPTLTIGAAINPALTTTVIKGPDGARSIIAQANFIYGAGGTTVDVYVQTSLDRGATWVDIMNFNFTTASAVKISKVDLSTALSASKAPTDGSLTSNTIVDGLIGDQFRLKYKSAGTYTGVNTIQVDLIIKG